MAAPELKRVASHGVTLLGDPARPGGVTLAFTERTGGVSTREYASLNLGDACGDDATQVMENRRRALAALGVEDLAARLVNPVQVHGDHVVVLADVGVEALTQAQAEARAGADAVVCAVADVPVLLCYADCVPVVLVCEGAFAVIHSGWKGTMARISAKALQVLCHVAGVSPHEVVAYVGPHVGVDDYEVSAELATRFSESFGAHVVQGERNLDLGACVVDTLVEAGVGRETIAVCEDSTASTTQRFYSFRAEGGRCGRHGALAVLSRQSVPATAKRREVVA